MKAVVDVHYYICQRLKLEGETKNMGVCTKEWERYDSRGTQVRRRFVGGSGRPSMLMFVRSAAALATMRPVLLLRVATRVLKNAARR